MKISRYAWIPALGFALLPAACGGQPPQLIIAPTAPVGERFPSLPDPLETWRIVDAQDAELPAWVPRFYDSGLAGMEELPEFADRYVFVGRNQGGSSAALRQWADNFCTRRDFAGLLVDRSERRFFARSLLYPEDEFGEFFIAAIRAISNGEFRGVRKEGTFWVKRRFVPDEGIGDGFPPPPFTERFEFLVLVSVDRQELEEQVLRLLADLRLTVQPTREQAMAIDMIKQTFFEGF